MSMAASLRPENAADVLVDGLEQQNRQLAAALRVNHAIGAVLVLATVGIAYGLPGASTLTFFSLIPLFLLQLQATSAQARLLTIRRAQRSLQAGLRLVESPHWFFGAALAIRQAYFVLLLCFDTSWLLHAYLLPAPAASFASYLERLRVGIIPGLGFLLFTVVFWLVYSALFAWGAFLKRDPIQGHAIGADRGPGPQRIPFSVTFAAADGSPMRLNGLRLPRPGGQPLILWPGFFQNGLVYDLLPGEVSLAESLWERGCDIWIVHSRATGGSGGHQSCASLDDIAAVDVPAFIRFVRHQAGRRPIYVGHSQGGLTAIMSLMGPVKDATSAVSLSDEAATARQDDLLGLVTLGSFPDFTFLHKRWLPDLVRDGIQVTLGSWRFPVLPTGLALKLLRRFPLFSNPLGLGFRRALAHSGAMRLLLLPLSLVLDFGTRLPLWEFLYHLPNVSLPARRMLFLATLDATFCNILQQFSRTVVSGTMSSLDGAVNYSAHYNRLHLPCCFVVPEYDVFVEESQVREALFEGVSSERKWLLSWERLGHEDCFMAPGYFRLVWEAIERVMLQATCDDG